MNSPSSPDFSSIKINLTTFFLSIASAAYMGLGLTPAQAEGKIEINLPLARQNIDLLELMHEKTKGNLTPEEAAILDQLLFELRTRYVEKLRTQSSKA
ncbi:MAG: DUF1844 domain-containing protein [Cryobacterium sp.]|nr:DUF1844 domain-containing protein [Oligoflexia bacterium]